MLPNLAAAQQGLLAALHTGRLPRTQLVASVTRILTMKYRLAAGNTASAGGNTADRDSADEQATASKATAAAVTLLAGACHGPLVTGPVTVASTPGYAGTRNTLAAALRSDGVPIVPTGGTVIDLVGYGEDRDNLVPGAAVTVAVDTPYVLGDATSPVRIATYSSTPAAMTALAAVIAGRASAHGVSPVAVAGLPRSACGSGG
jgi:beta-N-acetylhexosaminidase